MMVCNSVSMMIRIVFSADPHYCELELRKLILPSALPCRIVIYA